MTRPERRYRWSDAERVWDESGWAERRVLSLLSLLPLAPTRALEPFGLVGSAGGADTLYRALRDLLRRGLIDSVERATWPGRAPRLHYLTDLGVAACSVGRGVDAASGAASLARRHGLGRKALLSRLPSLRPLLAAYDLLADLAWDAGGGAELVDWECPWRRRVLLPRARSKAYVSLPALATLGRPGGGKMSYCLLPDLGSVPILAYATALSRLTALQSQAHTIPTLVVGAPHEGRARAWRKLILALADSRRETCLASAVLTWDELQAAAERERREIGGSASALGT